MGWLYMRREIFLKLAEAIIFLLTAAAISIHAPGHVSMDTSMQLYEASTGRSVSWNPPFMSALMSWLGSGTRATTGIVFLNTILIYGSYALVIRALSAGGANDREGIISLWRVVLLFLVILNPVVAVYIGIVWKDVLFGALLTASAASGIAACTGSRSTRVLFACTSVLLLAPAFLIRQQGVFMAPFLLLVPAVALSATSPFKPRWYWAGFLAIFIVAVFGLSSAADRTIKDDGGRSSAQGFRSIMVFDMIGIVSFSPREASDFAVAISPEQLAAVRAIYDPSRIDYIARDPRAEGWLAKLSASELKHAWWASIKQNPLAYLKHRSYAYASLLGLRGIAYTQPVHIGVEGNTEFLAYSNVPPRRDARDILVYKVASTFFGWPIYAHFFWVCAAIFSLIAIFRVAVLSNVRAAALVILTSVVLFFASYYPTMLAADFRYLFAAIPLTSLVFIVIFMSPKRMRLGSILGRDLNG